MREELKVNEQLFINEINKVYTIKSIIGKGATCIVYDACYFDKFGLNHHVRIKECFPIQYTKSIRKNGHIVWNDEQAKRIGLDNFDKAYKRHLFFQNHTLFTNSTGRINDGLYKANNTKYIILDYFVCDTFDRIKNMSLHEIIKTGIALTKLVLKYHEQGYLLLDLKPENFLVIKETKEMVFLIDFDSIQHLNNIENNAIVSYSPEYAAPELLQGRIDKLGFETDIYAIGATLFSKIYDKKVTSNERRLNYKFSFDLDIFQELNPKARYYFQWLFSKTLSNNPFKRFKNCDELLEVLKKLEYYTDSKNSYLLSTNILQDNYFIGRYNELQTIDNFYMSGGQIVYLNGYGGIGKTELAKFYCHHNNYEFHTIVWLNYKGSIKNLILDDNTFDVYNTDINSYSTKEDKLRFLKHLVDSRTLFVLDNYDQMDEDLIDLLSLPCKMLITTRLQVKDLVDDHKSKIISMKTLKKEECINLFQHYYSVELPKEEHVYVEKLIDLFDRYSLIIPLLAKELRISDKLPSEKYDEIIKYGFKNSSKTKINHVKDNNITKETTYIHLKTVFNTAGLDEAAKRMLYILSFLGNINISKTEISFYAGLIDDVDDIIEHDKLKYSLKDAVTKYKNKIDLQTVNYLIDAGWVEYDEVLNMLSCHSIIRELIKNECVMPYSELKFFSYYIMKIIRKIYYDYIEENGNGVGLDSSNEYPYSSLIPWDAWTTNSYCSLIQEILKNKLIYGEEDARFYFNMLRYAYPFASIEITDIALTIFAEIKASSPDSNLIPDMCISLLPLVIATKEILYIGNNPPNKYAEDNYFVDVVESLIYVGYEFVEKQNDEYLMYQYIEEITYSLFVSDCLGVLDSYNTDKLLVVFCRMGIEYIQSYENMIKDHPKIQNEFVHNFEIKRDIYNFNLNVRINKYCKKLIGEDKEEKQNNIFSNTEDDESEIEYDNSAYVGINNDDVENITQNFLHHVYDYSFDLLLSDKVRRWYKEEQLILETENSKLEPLQIGYDNPFESVDHSKEYKYDKDYVEASCFLSQIPIADVGSCVNANILINYLLDKNYYMLMKLIFIYFDAYGEKESYEKAKPLQVDTNFMFLNSRMVIGKICDVFGFPEVGLEVCRLLCESYYNAENVNKVDVDEQNFQIEEFYNFYLIFAERSKDKKAFYHALTQKKYALGNRFEYNSVFESEYDLDTETMWQEIKKLFAKIEVVTKDTKDTLIEEINENNYISRKYKTILIGCLTRPITMADQYGMLDVFKPVHLLNYSDSVLRESIDKLDEDLNMVEKIYAYSEICYQYIIKDNKEMYLKFSKQFADELSNLQDYHNRFDYLSMIAIQKYLDLFSYFVDEYLTEDNRYVIEGYHYIAQALIKYINERWKNFDYFMMVMSYRGIARAYLIETLTNDCEKYKELVTKLTEKLEYLDKTWIGEDHIVNEFRDANADCLGRLDGTFTKERQQEYLKKVDHLKELWKNENHSKEEYQQKYHEIFDVCFPFPDFYDEGTTYDECLANIFKEHEEGITKLKAEADAKGERCIIQIGDEYLEI